MQLHAEQVEEKKVVVVDLNERQAYLRQQRDKLIAMKKEAREKAFGTVEQSQGAKSRPKTAKIARSAMKGQRLPSKDDGNAASARPSEQIIAARREIVKKLKQEVIGV